MALTHGRWHELPRFWWLLACIWPARLEDSDHATSQEAMLNSTSRRIGRDICSNHNSIDIMPMVHQDYQECRMVGR